MARLHHVQQQLAMSDAVLVLGPGDDFRYAVDWSPHADERLTFLWINEDHAHLVIPSVNAQDAREHMPEGVEVVEFSDQDGPFKALEGALARMAPNAETLYVSDDARFDHGQLLFDLTADRHRLHLASTLMAPMRMVKDDEEIARLEASQWINDRAMEKAFASIREGMTELELEDIIRRAFMENGADREAFIIVAAGANSALPHHASDETVIRPGPVLLDIGCFKDGYASDMTRVAYLGAPSEEFITIHAIVKEAAEAGVRAARSGIAAQEVDRASRQVISDKGFGQYFVHRTGHGIGLSVHEPPSMMEGNMLVLPDRAFFSVEPGIYLAGQFGVRLEDVVGLTPKGPKILSALPLDIHVVAQ